MKSIFKSKTFWFNVLSFVTAIAYFFDYVPNENVIEAATSLFVGLSPVIVPLANIILRKLTTQPVSITGK